MLQTPRRFNELSETIKNKGTLSIKLAELKKLGLIISKPVEIEGNYANGYVLSDKGRELLKKLDNLNVK